jgi:hypothetical protein
MGFQPRKGMEAIKAAASRTGGGGDTSFFNWQDGETKILRFLTDKQDIVTVWVHEQVISEGGDGKKRPFVCRTEFRDENNNPMPCELCARNFKRREKGYGIAVQRVEIRDDSNNLTGYADRVEEKEIDDNGVKKVKKVPVVGVVAQGPKNFWNYPYAFAEKYGTLRDRDYEVKRDGKDLKTTYHFFPIDPVEIPNLDERYANYLPELEKILEAMGSPAYYDKHLRGIDPKSQGDGQSNGTPQGGGPGPQSQWAGQQQTATIPDDETEFDRIRRENATAQAGAVSGVYE